MRFAGLTMHAHMKEATAAGIATGRYTLVMPVLNQPSFESMDAELRLAREKSVGVMAMKSMMGVQGIDLETAYLKKVLANPAVTTVVKGIGSFEMFDAYLQSMNSVMTTSEDRTLYRYAQANRSQNCMLCGDCREVCPSKVEVPTILRTKDYYHDQVGDRETAFATWATLPAAQTGSAACRDCRKCEEVCPTASTSWTAWRPRADYLRCSCESILSSPLVRCPASCGRKRSRPQTGGHSRGGKSEIGRAVAGRRCFRGQSG